MACVEIAEETGCCCDTTSYVQALLLLPLKGRNSGAEFIWEYSIDLSSLSRSSFTRCNSFAIMYFDIVEDESRLKAAADAAAAAAPPTGEFNNLLFSLFIQWLLFLLSLPPPTAVASATYIEEL